jgi:hypothetical protein
VLTTKRLACAGASFALTGVLAFGSAGLATAAPDKPIVGSVECTRAVNNTTAVSAAVDVRRDAREALRDSQNRLQAARDAVPFDQAAVQTLRTEVNDDQVDLNEAETALTEARATAQAALCTDEAPEPEPTPDPDPTPDPVDPAPGDNEQPPAMNPDSLRERIAELDCDEDYFAERGRISDAIVARLSESNFGELLGLLTDKERSLNYCIGEEGGAPAPIDNDVVVDIRDDDDSIADVDGTQVRVVPNGSIQTGGV